VGDNIGYQIGRRGGRWLLERPGRFHRQRLEVLATGEPFFERQGPKAVFFGRFILGLRIWASWLAGTTRMRWRSFFLWNALGGISWASTIGLLAYFLGHSASNAIEGFGIYGLVAVLLAIAGALFMHHPEISDRPAQQPLPQGAMRSHKSASALSSPSEKREKKCSLTTVRCVPRACVNRSRPNSVRQA
jgi:hypothetical protein